MIKLSVLGLFRLFLVVFPVTRTVIKRWIPMIFTIMKLWVECNLI